LGGPQNPPGRFGEEKILSAVLTGAMISQMVITWSGLCTH
jgi:hypothetical protein